MPGDTATDPCDELPAVDRHHDQVPLPVEVRHPYMDRRLYEMVLSMPQEFEWDFREHGGIQGR